MFLLNCYVLFDQFANSKYLQYKMFLLNLKNIGEIHYNKCHLQYKMFLLNHNRTIENIKDNSMIYNTKCFY